MTNSVGIRGVLALGFLGLWLGVWPPSAVAQYFGQNKVRYETLNWEVLKTQHFDIYYYQKERKAVEDFGRMAERWYARLSSLLQHELPPNQPLIVYESGTAFRGTTVIPGYIGETTGGVTEGLRRRIVMPFAGPLAETDHVLGHELVHAFQYDITTPRDTKGVTMGTPGAVALPLWFIEGMAEYLSIGAEDPHTAMWVRDAVSREQFPTIRDLDNPKYFPYRFGQAFWAYVAGRYGDEAVGDMLKAAGRARAVEPAIRSVLNTSAKELSEDWRQSLVDRFEPVLQATERADAGARLLVSKETKGGTINLSPAMSPDGRHLVFYSERDLFSIDMFLMDVESGRIRTKITETALDPHLDSLGFVDAAGAWSFDSRRFAYTSIREGRPELAIYDVERGRTVQRIRLTTLAEVLHVAWSPDGRQIALSGTQGGISDLWIVDVETEALRQLTTGKFAELQPDWSPDGSRIAFVTDRFTSNLDELSFGDYRLAMIDVASGNIQALPTFEEGKHANPQWSADGRTLFFVSDRDGISNLYAMDLADRRMRQLTNLRTGVTGISHLSPAFSVATQAGRLAFSSFREGEYDIYLIESAEGLAGVPPRTGWQGRIAGILPPQGPGTSQVARLINRPAHGLASPSGFTTTNYQPSLSLDYVAPPSIGVGLSSFGTAVGGGTALYWSDMLGQHNLMTAFQTSSAMSGNFVNNIGAFAAYQNQKTRWNWGFSGGQLPFVTGGYGSGFDDVDGRTVFAEDSVLFWQIERDAAATLSYPFNRARRVEFAGGFRNIAFDAQFERHIYDPFTGQYLGRVREDLPTFDSINLGTAMTAMVFDTSIFGGTSPILGKRYRLEFGVASGGLTYTSALADYRHYLRPFRWMTLAGRFMHYGRYGGGAEDARFQNIFLGYPALVRGYSAGTFQAIECGGAAGAGRCPAFDRLLGSRMAVANAEMRIPVLGALGVIESPYLPPVEIAPFFDSGVAWYRQQDNAVFRGDVTPVRSYGASLRVNLLGFAIGQISYVQPVNRQLKSWHWEFALIPGF
ncbi:MAG: PD40 domain-containing protein [Bryobacteraceae bacterium]|nr:PD40 domain-containing protein [Bryobacteraceae bacterium]